MPVRAGNGCGYRKLELRSLLWLAAPLSSQIIATALLLLLFLCFAAQIVVLIANRRR